MATNRFMHTRTIIWGLIGIVIGFVVAGYMQYNTSVKGS